MKSLYPLQDTPWELRPRKTSSVRNTFISSYWVKLTPSQRELMERITPACNYIYNQYLERFINTRLKGDRLRHFRYDMNLPYIMADARKTYGNIPAYIFTDMLDLFIFEMGALFDIKKTSSNPVWHDVYMDLIYIRRRVHEKRRLHYFMNPVRLSSKSLPVTKTHVYIRPLGWLRLENSLPQSIGRIRFTSFGYEMGHPLVSLVKDTTSQDLNYIEIPFKFPVGLLGKLWEITKFTPEDDWFVTSFLKCTFKLPFKCDVFIPENNYEIYPVYIVPKSIIGNRWLSLNEQEKEVVNARLIKRMYMILNNVSKPYSTRKIKWSLIND